jgi:hypothetical protein
MRWLLATTAVILAAGLATPGACAAPVYGLPIGILGATFSDGTTLTGEFTLNQYGYIVLGSLTTQDGFGLDGITPIAGITFTSSASSADLAASPAIPNVLHASFGQ